MTSAEQQAEELEVLESIYGGDEEFHKVSETSFQYKYGKDGERTSFLLEINWPESYPEVIPSFTLSAFYNNHLSKSAKSKILDEIHEESVKMTGEIQTYNMLEWVRSEYERLATLYIPETEEQDQEGNASDSENTKNQAEEGAKGKPKKEQLTKAQKRREWDKKDNKGEAVRGANWVDVVRHLSQTGSQAD